MPIARWGLALAGLALAHPVALPAQGLPPYAPINPVAASRSGLYFQPYLDSAPGWRPTVSLDYASTIELGGTTTDTVYRLDSEQLRLGLGLTREVGRNYFVTGRVDLLGSYAGFLDGFLNWYHGLLGLRVPEREQSPPDRFSYRVKLPDGRQVVRRPGDLFLGDLRIGLGRRHSPTLQSVLSVTLPTTTGPAGYGRGVPSFSLLHTARGPLGSGVMAEAGLGLGYTPRYGELASIQRAWFAAANGGLRVQFWGPLSLYGNVFYHSPYYHGTGAAALDRRELSFDFGGIFRTGTRGEWRIGMTEDPEPSGPAIDLVFRFARRF